MFLKYDEMVIKCDIKTGDIYTGVSDGRIVRIRNDRYKTVAQFGNPKKCVNPWEIEKCGRPLGVLTTNFHHLI